MKKSLAAIAATALTALFGVSANAQSPLWNGFYGGANLGAGINDSNYSFNPSGCFVSTACGTAGLAGNPARSTSGSLGSTALIFGAQGGYNWQFMPQWVVGVETDLDKNQLSTARSVTQPLGPPLFAVGSFTNRVSEQIPWFGTFRLRAGWVPMDTLLIYGTAGAAYGEVNSTSTGTFPPPGSADTYTNSVSRNQIRWTAGAGLEWMFASSWSLKAEYLYVDLGQTKYTNPCVSPAAVCGSVSPRPSYQTTLNAREHIARIGVNFHFGMPPAPPPATTVAAPPPPPAVVAPSKQMFIVFFEFDKSSLTVDGKKVVDAAAAAFKSGKSGVAISGYTDLAGTQQYNLALSKRRRDGESGAGERWRSGLGDRRELARQGESAGADGGWRA